MSELPEPRANPLLFGHAAAEATLADAMRSGRLHHAWLMTGPEGIGKATLAFRFARRLLAGPAADGTLHLAPEHPAFRRVTAGSHADLLTVERTVNEKTRRLRGEIVVEDVREVSDFLRLTPAEGGWRVVVVDGAEDLNRNAANALLKVLEEPPSRAVLLLVCSAAGRLLPTLRSRCRRLRMESLGPPDMEEVLSRALPSRPAAERALLASAAEGSPGRALALAASAGVDVAALLRDVLAALPELPPLQAHAVADAIGRDEDAFAAFFDMLRTTIAAAVRHAARGAADADQSRLLGSRGLDAWIDVWQGLGTLRHETVGLHLDKRQALISGLGLLRP